MDARAYIMVPLLLLTEACAEVRENTRPQVATEDACPERVESVAEKLNPEAATELLAAARASSFESIVEHMRAMLRKLDENGPIATCAVYTVSRAHGSAWCPVWCYWAGDNEIVADSCSVDALTRAAQHAADRALFARCRNDNNASSYYVARSDNLSRLSLLAHRLHACPGAGGAS